MNKLVQGMALLGALLFLGGCPVWHHCCNDSEGYGPGHHHHHYSAPTPAAKEIPGSPP